MDALKYVYEIPLGDAKAFIINGEKTILVDTGIAPFPPEVFTFVEETGFKLADEQQIEHLRKGSFQFIMDFIKEKGFTIETIICTHYHPDHTGCLKKLKETLNVPVAMHPLDIPFIEGKESPPPSAMLPPKLAEYFKTESCKVDIALEDNQMFTTDLQVIHLEGHTKGHLCLLFKEEVLLAGDAIMGKNALNPEMGPNELNPPTPITSMDQEKAVSNLKKLLGYKFKVILPSHGESIKANAKEKLKKLIVETQV